MLMDRILDLYREYYGYLRSGVRTLAITEEEALKRLRAFVEKLNEHYKSIAKQVTGAELSLQHDEAYLKLWVSMIAELRDIEAVERARVWWSRVSGWLLYRIAYGYVKPEDIDKLVDEISKVIPLHELEIRAYKAIAKAVLGLVGRELVPAPSTLATLAEYVAISPELVKKSLDTYRVPEEWRPIWERYIAVRPFADDARVAITAYYRALRYSKYFTAIFGKLPEFEIPKEVSDRVEALMSLIGMTDQERAARELAATIDALIDLMRERARELKAEMREWRPSLLTLITISEYVPEAAKLLEKYVIDPEFKPVVLKYAFVKPLADDVRVLVSAYYRAVRAAALYKQEIPKEVAERVEKIFKDFGVTEVEKAIRDLAVYLQILVDEWREAAKEYIPTPSTLASMAEHLPEVRKYAPEALAARHVRGVWYEMWMKYIFLRPVVDEVRRWADAMFDLAEYAVIPVKQLEPVFKILATYGWEELEIKIAERTILAIAARRAFAWLVGTPRELTAMSRYTDKAADMAWTRVSQLVDLLPVDDATKQLIKQMWREYITVYQASPEISGYLSELVAAYGDGVLDDRGLEEELQMLRKLGVPELRLQLAKRRAYLRRARRLARMRS
jgi:molybdopterin converting factor small subunit